MGKMQLCPPEIVGLFSLALGRTMDAREVKRTAVLSSLLGEATRQLRIVPLDLQRSLEAYDFDASIAALVSLGEEQEMLSYYWRKIKQAADVVGNKELAHFARRKRRDTGLTDM